MNHPKMRGLVCLISLATTLFAADMPKSPAAAGSPAPTVAWGRQWGTGGEDFGRAVTADSLGRCFVAGSTAGDLAAKNAGKSDALVVAFDLSGGRLWATQFGSPEDDTATSVAIGPGGTLYVAGTTGGKLADSAADGKDIFVAKLSPAGQIVWLRQFGSPANDDGAAIVSDREGNVYVTGSTEGKMGERQFGGADVFLLKLDANGAKVWACQWGSDQPDMGRGLAIDAAGALYVTGATAGTIGGSANAGELDVFVSKIEPTGAVAWTHQFGTARQELGMNLCVASDGSLYVGGSSAGEFAAGQAGNGDAILLKLTPTGELVWKRQFGTSSWDGVHGIALSTDGAESVIVGGCQNWPKCQGFLRSFDRDGRELWSTLIPTDQSVCGTQIAVLGNGGIVQTGGTHGAAFGEYRGEGNDLVLVRFNPLGAPATPAAPTATAQRQPVAAKGPYLGQKSPGRTPQVFAPGILSRPDRMEARVAFSPDGLECYFTSPADFSFSKVQLYYTRCVNGEWTPQELAPFGPAAQPFFATDGRTLYFSSNRNGSGDIWAVDRVGEIWATPRALEPPVNTPSAGEGEYSRADDGTAYFESTRPGGKGQVGLWRVRSASAGQAAVAEHLGGALDSGNYDADPFISRDGRQLLFSSGRPGGAGKADLYVASALDADHWSEPVNLNTYCPGINTDAIEYGPSLSIDGRYLFFVRLNPEAKQCDVWWVENPLSVGPGMR